MKFRRALPWGALVLTSATFASAQATVGDDPARNGDDGSIAAAARDRRSISLNGPNARVSVPEFHVVERGDTLWDITGSYFDNPWRWPRVWGLNPQITNPHWIFPGDQVRLLRPEDVAVGPIRGQAQPGMPAPRNSVPPQTVFLRDEGWLDPREADDAGTIVGSPEDQMLLADGDQAYVEFRRRTPRVGETYTIYQEGQPARGGDRNAGHVVRVLGTAVVEGWDRDRRVATVRVTESLDSIERGERVAAIPRRLEVVPPVRNTVDLRGHIVATVYPRELLGQNMVVFIDRGRDDRVVAGNRWFVLRRGDAWRQSLTTDAAVATGTGLDRNGDGRTERPPGRVRADRNLPEEIVGEILVVDVRPRTATAIVTSSVVEVAVGDVIEMRRGY